MMQTKTIEELRREITEAFSAHWLLNDPAHRAEHFNEVYQTGKLLAERTGIEVDLKLILFTAYFHDLFAWSRQNHHELSYEFVLNTDHPVITQNLTTEERGLVAWACRQHRASFKGDFNSLFAQLMNAADRGMPGTVKKTLGWAIQYRKAHNPKETIEQITEASIQHVKEKFGSQGYARYPDIYQLVFNWELTELRKAIDQI